MSLFHKKCPICSQEMNGKKHISELFFMDNKTIPYIEYFCLKLNHTYHEFSSLYNQLLWQAVELFNDKISVRVNYIKSVTHFKCWTEVTNPLVQELKGTVWILDFPHLENTKKKINLLLPFI